jgi:Flp pilus assembly protein TadG
VRLLQRFCEDQRGNTAIIFGLAVIPLIALGGGIVDFANRAKARGDLQSAVDTAAIAAARVVQLGRLKEDADQDAVDAEAVAAATHFIDAALARIGGSDAANLEVEVEGEAISISARYGVDTSFLGVVGIHDLDASAMAEVSLPDLIRAEIALVLDYSGSMRDNDKYVRMTDAARDFIAKVEKDRGETSKIGIVPFSEYVYARMDADDIREPEESASDDDNDRQNEWRSVGSLITCLLNRGYPYSATDQAPSSSLPASQWPEGDRDECENYADARLRVRDLTDEFEEVSSALAIMRPVGLTNISLAMEMGWHMLTPDAPFDAARDFSEPNVEKIIILLTDGMQTVPAEGPSGEISTLSADEVTAELCDSAKDAGIRIFSIAYDVEDEAVETLLRGCASGSGYFDASVTEISGVFEEIYSQIAESVWLSR